MYVTRSSPVKLTVLAYLASTIMDVQPKDPEDDTTFWTSMEQLADETTNNLESTELKYMEWLSYIV